MLVVLMPCSKSVSEEGRIMVGFRTGSMSSAGRVEWVKTTHCCFSQNNHEIKSGYIFFVTMDYIDKSDAEVFNMKLTLVIYRRENAFHSKLSHF